MSRTKSIGTTLDIAATFGTTKAFTAVSNAASAVFTLEASHGVIVGDILEILTCSWGSLERRCFRASAVATNDVTFELCDTSNTSRFPAGTITGTVREVLTWTRIDNRSRDFSGSGGELQTADISALDDFDDRDLPISRSAQSRSFPGYHDVGRAWVTAVRSASDNSDTPVPAREIYPSSARLLYSAFWSFFEVPTPQDNTLRDRIDLRFAARPTAYAN